MMESLKVIFWCLDKRCGKTNFVQNLEKNGNFGDIKEVYWLSKISLSQER